jgi:hypothetical protein
MQATELDAKGITTLGGFFLSFFFLFFSLSVYLSRSLFDCEPSLPVDFFGSPFSFFLFVFLFSLSFLFLLVLLLRIS